MADINRRLVTPRDVYAARADGLRLLFQESDWIPLLPDVIKACHDLGMTPREVFEALILQAREEQDQKRRGSK